MGGCPCGNLVKATKITIYVPPKYQGPVEDVLTEHGAKNGDNLGVLGRMGDYGNVWFYSRGTIHYFSGSSADPKKGQRGYNAEDDQIEIITYILEEREDPKVERNAVLEQLISKIVQIGFYEHPLIEVNKNVEIWIPTHNEGQ